MPVKSQQRAVFFRCVATLFDSGVPLLASFDLLTRQTESRRLALASQSICLSLYQGQTLSACLERHPKCFSNLHVALIRVGERSGSLSAVFARIAEQEEHYLNLVQKVRSGLMLPLIVTAVCLSLIFLIAPLLLGSVLREMGIDYGQLPWMTKILVSLSDLLRSKLCWLFGLLLVTTVITGLLRYYRRPGFQRGLSQLLDRIPGLGRTLRLYATVRFIASLEMTLSVGIPLLNSLQMAFYASGNALLNERLGEVLNAARDGWELDRALGLAEFLPSTTLQGIKAGQESGSLTSMLRSLQRIHQIDLDYATHTFTQALEPLVLAVVGLLVGFCVVATMLPLVQLVDKL